MNKQELLEKIDVLINEATLSKERAKENEDNLNAMYYIGEITGLLYAKRFIIDLKE